MSLEAVTWTWEHSRSRNAARVVLLAIATAADDVEHKAVASMSFLEKRANAKRPTVVAAVRDLIRLGEIEVVEGETGPYGAAVYRALMPPPPPLRNEPYKKKAVPLASRRALAARYGCPPGETITVPCEHCGEPGRITWWRLYSGKPSGWVTFDHEIDHVKAEVLGGASTADNLQLLCQHCNRKKGARV